MTASFRLLMTTALSAALIGSSAAHEMWLEAQDFTPESGAAIIADIKVGDDFSGGSYSYQPRNLSRFDIAVGGDVRPVDSERGDMPAVNEADVTDGLAVLIYESATLVTAYNSFEKFERFLAQKDIEWAAEVHRDRGLPDARFREAYSRYSKSLIGVGSAAGSDQTFGLLTEITALENPYTDDLSDGFDVRVTYQDEPRSEAQIEVFSRSTGGDDVRRELVTTDADGLATIPTEAGRLYLLDAVVMREPEAALAEEINVVWESLWASMSFEVPETITQ